MKKVWSEQEFKILIVWCGHWLQTDCWAMLMVVRPNHNSSNHKTWVRVPWNSERLLFQNVFLQLLRPMHQLLPLLQRRSLYNILRTVLYQELKVILLMSKENLVPILPTFGEILVMPSHWVPSSRFLPCLAWSTYFGLQYLFWNNCHEISFPLFK